MQFAEQSANLLGTDSRIDQQIGAGPAACKILPSLACSSWPERSSRLRFTPRGSHRLLRHQLRYNLPRHATRFFDCIELSYFDKHERLDKATGKVKFSTDNRHSKLSRKLLKAGTTSTSRSSQCNAVLRLPQVQHRGLIAKT